VGDSFLHVAGVKRCVEISSCMMQEQKDVLKFLPASCRSKASGGNSFLQVAGAKHQVIIPSCTLQEQNIV